MARPSQIQDQRIKLLPKLTSTFVELGYRGATTKELSRRLGVQENILYRLWPDKKAMFIAAIQHVFDNTGSIWEKLCEEAILSGQSIGQALLTYESEHIGEFGNHRILFSALSELNDDEIREALLETYQKFFQSIQSLVENHREQSPDSKGASPPSFSSELVAWSILGLGTISTISKELQLSSDDTRKGILTQIAHSLL